MQKGVLTDALFKVIVLRVRVIRLVTDEKPSCPF